MGQDQGRDRWRWECSRCILGYTQRVRELISRRTEQSVCIHLCICTCIIYLHIYVHIDVHLCACVCDILPLFYNPPVPSAQMSYRSVLRHESINTSKITNFQRVTWQVWQGGKRWPLLPLLSLTMWPSGQVTSDYEIKWYNVYASGRHTVGFGGWQFFPYTFHCRWWENQW